MEGQGSSQHSVCKLALNRPTSQHYNPTSTVPRISRPSVLTSSEANLWKKQLGELSDCCPAFPSAGSGFSLSDLLDQVLPRPLLSILVSSPSL